MDALYIILTAILGLACVIMIYLILKQKKREGGFSGAMTGQDSGGSEKTHFDKSKRRTNEGRWERWTKILATVFMVLALFISLML